MLLAKILFANATLFITDRTRLAVTNMAFNRMLGANNVVTIFYMMGMLCTKRLLADSAGFATGMTTGCLTSVAFLCAWGQCMADRTFF